MYKTIGRWMIRRNIERLNQGDYAPVLSMFAGDATLAFPGDNDFAAQYRPVQKGRTAHATHRGKAELEGFLRKYVDSGIQMVVEDIVMSGMPWRIRVAMRVHVWSPGPDGTDRYTNRAVMYAVMRWGRLSEQEDYEDSERAAAFADLLVGRTG